MGEYQNRYWEPDGDGMTRAERRGGVYHPYMPDALCGFDFMLNASCADAVVRAQEAVADLERRGATTNTEPLARLILRAEALSSSRIEGLELPVVRLLEYEELDRLGVSHRVDGTEAQVLGNIAALDVALNELGGEGAFTAESLCELHGALMRGTSLERFGGVVRTEQNWIGGNRVNPVGAAYVPPVPEAVPALLGDLAEFLNAAKLPAVAVAAIAHAQFETIHPFVDGNGRAGRALIHLVFRKRGLVAKTLPPLSLILATDRERYISNLAAYRATEEFERVDAVNDWIEYFARALLLACERSHEFENVLAGIRQNWQDLTDFRAGSAGRQVLDVLLGTPVISIKTAQELIGKSYPAARQAVLELERIGILRQNSKNRKSGIYVADEVVRAFSAYERALATLSGDTAAEKPRRAVPQRS